MAASSVVIGCSLASHRIRLIIELDHTRVHYVVSEKTTPIPQARSSLNTYSPPIWCHLHGFTAYHNFLRLTRMTRRTKYQLEVLTTHGYLFSRQNILSFNSLQCFLVFVQSNVNLCGTHESCSSTKLLKMTCVPKCVYSVSGPLVTSILVVLALLFGWLSLLIAF